jgi:hypothetical protein
MIRILLENQSDEINIKGLIETGCKACKEAIVDGFGNFDNCKTCRKNEIEFYNLEKRK